MKKIFSSVLMMLFAVCAFAQSDGSVLNIADYESIGIPTVGFGKSYIYDASKGVLTVNPLALALNADGKAWFSAGTYNEYTESAMPDQTGDFAGNAAYEPTSDYALKAYGCTNNAAAPMTFTVTNCTKVSAYGICSYVKRRNGANIVLKVLDADGKQVAFVPKTTTTAFTMTVDNLDETKTYTVQLYDMGAAGSYRDRFYEVAFYQGNNPAPVQPAKFEATWTPDTAYLNAPDSIKLTLSQKDVVSFSGVKFSYLYSTNTLKDEVVELASIAAKDTLDGGIVYAIPAPTNVKKNKAVNMTVSLVDQQNLDGAERDVIATTYNPVTLKIIAPKALAMARAAQIDTLFADDSIKVQLPVELHERIGVIYWAINNVTTGETVKYGYFNKSMAKQNKADFAKGIWGSDFVQDQVFYEDNEYTLVAYALMQDRAAWETIGKGLYAAADSITGIVGTTEQYKYSTANFVSISPNDKYVIEKPEDAVITITYDAPVKITKSSAYTVDENRNAVDVDSVAAVNEAGEKIEAEYSKIWKIYAQSYIKSSPAIGMELHIGAVDENGLRVLGNAGIEGTANYYISYENAYGAPTSTLTPANNATVDCLDRIGVANSLGLALAGYMSNAKFTVTDEDGNIVATCDSLDITDLKTSKDKSPKSVDVVLTKKITKKGKYVVDIPYSFFILGNDQNTYLGGHQTDTIYVSGAQDYIAPITITPDTTSAAEGATERLIESLSEIVLTFNEEIDYDWDATVEPTLVNVSTRAIADTKVIISGKNTFKVVLKDVLVADEESNMYFALTIPAGYIVASDGRTNDVINLYFVIGKEQVTPGEEENVTADPANGSTVTSLKKINITFSDQSFVGNAFDTDIVGTVKNADGEQVATFNCNNFEIDYSLDLNALAFSLSDEITTAGTYTLTFPAGIIATGEYGDGQNKAFTLTYTVEGTNGINGISTDADAATTIYNVAGQKVQKAVKGLYIINGKKVYVK